MALWRPKTRVTFGLVLIGAALSVCAWVIIIAAAACAHIFQKMWENFRKDGKR